MVDLDFNTHFFELKDDRWSKFKTIASVPVKNFIVNNSNMIFAFGDWGRLFNINKNTIEKIDTPIEGHIISGMFDEDSSLWLGTNAHGVFNLKNNRFHKYQFEGMENEAVLSVAMSKGEGPKIIGKSGNIYEFDGNQFLPVSKNLNRKIILLKSWIDKEGQAFAFGSTRTLLKFRHGKWQEIDFQYNELLYDYYLLEDNSVLLSGTNGSIFLPRKRGHLYFVDEAVKKNINGNAFGQTIGSHFIDLNNDQKLDLFVHNQKQPNDVYMNSGELFYNFSYQSQIPKFDSNDKLIFEDFNNDQYPDIFAVLLDTSGYVYESFMQAGNGTFNLQWRKEPEIKGQSSPRFLLPINSNNSSSIDIVSGFHYNIGHSAGSLNYLNNRLWGWSFNEDTTLLTEAKGWFTMGISADFNNDDNTDMLLLTNWRQNQLLLQNAQNDSFTITYIDSSKNNTHGALAIDYDNDGDLDIFQINDGRHLQIYNNDGYGDFKNITQDAFQDFDQFHLLTLNCGDFNQDGYIDLIGSNDSPGTNRNWILLNNYGLYFYDGTEESGLKGNSFKGSVVGDIDSDGDLDIYGFRNGPNSLWVNSLNNSNFLVIQCRGIISNSSGRGSKIWVYDSGHLDNADYLRGYRQIGSDNFAPNQKNSQLAHFGVPANNVFDIKVRFPSGKIQILKDITSGQTLIVNEFTGPLAVYYSLPGIIFRLATNVELIFYISVILIVLLLIYFSINYGHKKYRWEFASILWAVLPIFTVFWLLLFLTEKNDNTFLKYILPVLVVVAGIIISFTVSERILYVKRKYNSGVQSLRGLVGKLQVFSHGEWVMMNLNSLQLLSENGLGKAQLSDEFINIFKNRAQTFIDMTNQTLEKLINQFERAEINHANVEKIKGNAQFLYTALTRVLKGNFDSKYRLENYRLISSQIHQIKEILNTLKDDVYSRFSSDILLAIKNISTALDKLTSSAGVKLKIESDTSRPAIGLIPSDELGFIIDNLIRNGIQGTKGKAYPEITIKVYHFDPFIRIDVIDNGKGIMKQDWDRVFESGYSTFKGTGKGLYQSQQILGEFGGRIFISSSQIDYGTVFTIEFIEGKQKDETKNTDH